MLDRWHREDRRLLVGALNGIAFALALGVLLRQVDWPSKGIGWWGVTTQFLGVITTFGGLSYAYIRARYGGIWPWLDRIYARVERLWKLLRGKPMPVVVSPRIGVLELRPGSPFLFMGTRLDRAQRLQDQLAQIENYINTLLAKQLGDLNKRIDQVGTSVEEVRTLALAAAEKAFADAKAEIDKLAAQLARMQVIDLRWAILGALITVTGYAMYYWA